MDINNNSDLPDGAHDKPRSDVTASEKSVMKRYPWIVYSCDGWICKHCNLSNTETQYAKGMKSLPIPSLLEKHEKSPLHRESELKSSEKCVPRQTKRKHSSVSLAVQAMMIKFQTVIFCVLHHLSVTNLYPKLHSFLAKDIKEPTLSKYREQLRSSYSEYGTKHGAWDMLEAVNLCINEENLNLSCNASTSSS